MLAIQDSRVLYDDGKWVATCSCGRRKMYATKNSCLAMLRRGSCRNCKKDYRAIIGDVPIYKRADGKWCSSCSGCGNEQAYTRKDHAKQSEVSDWQCKKCNAQSKKYAQNRPVGPVMRMYNKFRKSANSRGISWDINVNDFESCFTGQCALTGWSISMDYTHCTASFDRIDSSKPYEIGNVQWVHSMVNMSKNKYLQEDFINMCKAVAAKAGTQNEMVR